LGYFGLLPPQFDLNLMKKVSASSTQITKNFSNNIQVKASNFLSSAQVNALSKLKVCRLQQSKQDHKGGGGVLWWGWVWAYDCESRNHAQNRRWVQ
jgi:hypothetical protein